MSDLPAILGTSTTVEIGGKRWTFSPLTIADEAELEVELRLRLGQKLCVVDQVRSILQGLSADERVAMLTWAVREEFRLRRMGPLDLAAEFRLPEVDRLVLRYQLRRHHQNVTDEEIGAITSDFSARKALAMLAQQLVDAVPKELGPALAALVAMTGRAKAELSGDPSSERSPSGSDGP